MNMNFQLCFCNCAILDIPRYAFFQKNTPSEKESTYDRNSLTFALIEKKGKYSALNVTSLKQNNRLEINQARLLVNQGATCLGH
jgi:hypothetical protein